jgi:hypothetical protein
LVIHFLWLKGASNEQIKSQIKETYGYGVIYIRSVQRWTHDFAAGRTELDALQRSGRPIDPENGDRIREILESKLYISQKALSRKLNLHQDTVHRILIEKLGLCKVNFKWIPYSLTESHKQECVRMTMKLLRFLEEFSPQKLANVFTTDESWFYLDNPQNSMWLTSGVPRPGRVRRNLGARKVMIWICFPRSRRCDAVTLSPWERVTRDFFIDEVFEGYDQYRSERRQKKRSYGPFCSLTMSAFDSMGSHPRKINVSRSQTMQLSTYLK